MEFLIDAVDRFPVREEFADSLTTQIQFHYFFCWRRGVRLRMWVRSMASLS